MRLQAFTFNPFAENTYLISDATGVAAVIDPGCSNPVEQAQLQQDIEQQGFTLSRLLLTHCHIDHVMGNAYLHHTYGLLPEHHINEVALLADLPQQSRLFGVPAQPSPAAVQYLQPGTYLEVGSLRLQVLFTPGHSPGSVCFYHAASNTLIGGDVLFKGSIGRTDLPGGNYETLMKSIFTVLLPLGDSVKVYPGHGPATTIGHERLTNPFLN